MKKYSVLQILIGINLILVPLAILSVLLWVVPSLDAPTSQVFNTETPAPSPTMTQVLTEVVYTATLEPSPTPEPTSTIEVTPIGFGIDIEDVTNFYQIFEFEFQFEEDAQGNQYYVGTISDWAIDSGGSATVEILGRADDVYSLSMEIYVPNPATETQVERILIYLTSILTTAADDWVEGMDWFNESLSNIGESRAEYEGREAILRIELEKDFTHVDFAIRVIQ